MCCMIEGSSRGKFFICSWLWEFHDRFRWHVERIKWWMNEEIKFSPILIVGSWWKVQCPCQKKLQKNHHKFLPDLTSQNSQPQKNPFLFIGKNRFPFFFRWFWNFLRSRIKEILCEKLWNMKFRLEDVLKNYQGKCKDLWI